MTYLIIIAVGLALGVPVGAASGNWWALSAPWVLYFAALVLVLAGGAGDISGEAGAVLYIMVLAGIPVAVAISFGVAVGVALRLGLRRRGAQAGAVLPWPGAASLAPPPRASCDPAQRDWLRQPEAPTESR